MQAGKTTVILPLLALYLADGSQLLMQVVPAGACSLFPSLLIVSFQCHPCS